MAIDDYLKEIRRCKNCAGQMSHDPRPILQVGVTAKIAIFGQAPGNLAHQSGLPFSDPSGIRLREWLSVDEDTFYDKDKIAIVPMGFCFPGYDKNGGDLPLLTICAEIWRKKLLTYLNDLEVCVLVGGYAQKWHLDGRDKKTVTETVASWREIGLKFIPTPHPSWRNNGWIRKNPWFETDLLPHLRKRVKRLIYH